MYLDLGITKVLIQLYFSHAALVAMVPHPQTRWISVCLIWISKKNIAEFQNLSV